MGVDQVRGALLPKLVDLEAACRARFGSQKFTIDDSPTGSLTNFQGHSFFLECRLPEPHITDVGLVSFGVELCHLTTTARVNASVSWGHPDGTIEAEFADDYTTSDEWPVLDEDTLAAISADFARLAQAFVRAIDRGGPRRDELLSDEEAG
jgi:hypothetical protein